MLCVYFTIFKPAPNCVCVYGSVISEIEQLKKKKLMFYSINVSVVTLLKNVVKLP